MKKYYDYPTQVVFIESYQVEEYGSDYDIGAGIAYGDMVICGCCGSTIPLCDIIWIKDLDWFDLTEAIRGDFEEGCFEVITEEDRAEYKAIVDKYIKEFEGE